jgi:hypothetical protein
LGRVVEKHKGDDCDERDQQHEAALVFPENLNHKNDENVELRNKKH